MRSLVQGLSTNVVNVVVMVRLVLTVPAFPMVLLKCWLVAAMMLTRVMVVMAFRTAAS
jgi:hypothetical protein